MDTVPGSPRKGSGILGRQDWISMVSNRFARNSKPIGAMGAWSTYKGTAWKGKSSAFFLTTSLEQMSLSSRQSLECQLGSFGYFMPEFKEFHFRVLPGPRQIDIIRCVHSPRQFTAQ